MEKPESKSVKGGGLQSFRSQGVDRQAKVAVVLMAVIPSLAFFYIGVTVADQNHPGFTPLVAPVILFSTIAVAAAGWIVLRKYARNIARLRRYVQEIAGGALHESVQLYQSGSSDDLQCIEDGLNLIMRELEQRIELVEQKLRIEYHLRKALEEQQQALLDAERHRVMLQSLGAACHHLGQPATALRLRFYLMKERAVSLEELDEIDANIRDVEAIEEILRKLRDVNEYRTEPYLKSYTEEDGQILAI